MKRKILSIAIIFAFLLPLASFPQGALAADLTSIYDIQYTTDPSGDSPYEGNPVTTQGIVTGFFYDGGNRYTFIQDGSGDQLDGLLCAIQAGWAYTQRDHNYGIPADCDPLEGWIADPVLIS